MLKRALLCSLLLAASAAAADTPVRVGYFDTQRAFREIVQAEFVRRANAEFNAWVKGINAGLEAEQRALAAMRVEALELRRKGEQTKAAALEEQYAERRRALDETFRKNAADIAARRLATRDVLEDQMLYLVRELAEERGFTVVFEMRHQVLLYSTDSDVTDEVVRRHRLRFQSMESPFAMGLPAEMGALRMPMEGAAAVEGFRLADGKAAAAPEYRPERRAKKDAAKALPPAEKKKTEAAKPKELKKAEPAKPAPEPPEAPEPALAAENIPPEPPPAPPAPPGPEAQPKAAVADVKPAPEPSAPLWSPEVEALHMQALAALKDKEQAKALEIWERMLALVPQPFYAVASQPLCGPVNVSYRLEKSARPRAFAIAAGGDCVRIVLSLHRSPEEAAAAAPASFSLPLTILRFAP